MSYGFIAIGLLFLALPSVSVIDFLPDFIGYAALIFGLSRIADLNDRLEDAISGFKKLFWIDLCKSVIAIGLNSLGDETTTMLVNFVYSIVTVILMLSAFSAFAEGFVYLGMRGGAEEAGRDPQGFKLIMQVFIIVRTAACLIPDLTVLTNEAYSDQIDIITGHTGTLYEYRTLIMTVCAMLSLAIGALFYIKTTLYVRGVCRSDGFRTYVIKRYETEISENRPLLIKRAVKAMYGLIFAGLLFFGEIRFSGIDILPDFVGFILITAGLFMGRKYVKGAKDAAVTGAMASVLAIITWAVNTYTAVNYFHKTAVLTDEAVNAYTLSAGLNTVKYAMLCFFAVRLWFVLRNTLKEHAVFSGELGEREKQKCNTLTMCFSAAVAVLAVVGSAMSFLYIYNEVFSVVSSVLFFALAIFSRFVFDKLIAMTEKKYM